VIRFATGSDCCKTGDLQKNDAMINAPTDTSNYWVAATTDDTQTVAVASQSQLERLSAIAGMSFDPEGDQLDRTNLESLKQFAKLLQTVIEKLEEYQEVEFAKK
jgi:hypothetical protein